MSNLNDFLVQNLPALHKFFDQISVPQIFFAFSKIQENANLEIEENEDIPENVRKNAIYYLHSFVEQNKAKIIADLSTVDEETMQKFQALVQDLGNAPVAKRD